MFVPFDRGFLARAMVHSTREVGDVWILGKYDEDGRYKMRVQETGVVCKGILNPFNFLYYADDLYEKVPEESSASDSVTSVTKLP